MVCQFCTGKRLVILSGLFNLIRAMLPINFMNLRLLFGIKANTYLKILTIPFFFYHQNVLSVLLTNKGPSHGFEAKDLWQEEW